MSASPRRRGGIDQPDYPHGTTGYTYGCRCKVCREAVRDYRRARRAAGRDLSKDWWRKQREKRVPGAIMVRTHPAARAFSPKKGAPDG